MFGIGARTALIGLRRIMMRGVPSPGMGNSIHSAKVKPTKEPAQNHNFVLLKIGYIEVFKTRWGEKFQLRVLLRCTRFDGARLLFSRTFR